CRLGRCPRSRRRAFRRGCIRLQPPSPSSQPPSSVVDPSLSPRCPRSRSRRIVPPSATGAPAPAVTVTTALTSEPPIGRYSFWKTSALKLLMDDHFPEERSPPPS